MKNSLFKRVAAAAAAVPLALTQCLTFSSVAAENDAVQIVGNTVQDGTAQTVSLEKLLYIPANKTESTWNFTAISALSEMAGTKGTVNSAKILEALKNVPENYRDAAKAALEKYVLVNPVTYEITADKDIVFKATVSQPNFNGNYNNTPGQALSAIAEEYNAPALKNVDFSSVKVAGDLVVTVKASALNDGTTVPVSVVYKTADGDIYAGDFAKFANEKFTELEEVAKAAIAKEVAADKVQEATDKFLAKTALIRNKITQAEKAVNAALTKKANYKSVSEALTAANEFLAKKNINKKIPTSAAAIAANETVQNYYNKAVSRASDKADIQITADQLGAFIDGLTTKTLNDNGTEIKTELNIELNNGKATLVGAFDDAEAADVQKWVESMGYAYVGSYKKLTGTVDFNGVKTADTASVDVQIERILVTETTTTSETTTSDTTTSATTTTDVTDTTTTDVTDTTTTDVTDTTTTDVTDTTTTDVTDTTTTKVTDTTTTDVTDTTTTDVTETTTTDVTETTTTDVTDTTTTDVTDTTTTDVTETTTTDVTDTTTTDVTDTTTTDVTETTTTDVTDTTTTDVTDTTTTDVTESTTTSTTAIVTSTVKTQYIEIESVAGFYFNTEASFDKDQIKKAILHDQTSQGYTDENGTVIITNVLSDETTDITAELTFGDATPANTYKAVENQFLYRVPVYYNGAVAKDDNGNDLTVTAYIGLKGDTDLNNIVDGRDATATLSYYSKISTEDFTATNTALSPSELVSGNAESVYDDFAAFLSDVKVDDGNKMSRFATKGERLIDGRDASSILSYFAKSSTEEYKDMAANEPAKLWDIVTGDAEEA
ncbi:MAG: cellulose-binding protein CttA-related protein [Ruminococcus sp.]|nr:cellulose-binding protein CttA-related protein [Ruminococcus sp.]